MADDNVDIWSLDEVHFQQYGSRCQMWVPPEIKEPVLRHHPTRKSVGYFGAVRIRDGKFVYQRQEKRFNGESFGDFLKQLRKASCQAKRKVYVILDNATYHHARVHKQWRELCSKSFALLFLPAYSPDLNPIERVWKLTRRLSVHNRYFPELSDVVKSVEFQFDQWSTKNGDLRRLCVI